MLAIQAPTPEAKWFPDFVSRIPVRGWVGIAVGSLLLLAIILYYFTIEEIEFGIPPKVKFKRKTDKAESDNQAAQTKSKTVSQTASGGGVNIGEGSVGPTFTGAIHGDVIIGASSKHEDPLTKAAAQVERLQPSLVHPYPLQANFTGRLTERQELTEWLADGENPIGEIVALGGMGKSALTWYWVKNDVLTSTDMDLDGVMWWSFQEVESSFGKFVDEALIYVTGQAVDTTELPTTYDRMQELRQRLQNKRILFVLDGFERQLRSYASLDAAYQDHEADQMSHDARACVDPNAARLLPYLASGPTRAKVLLTTRLSVSNLEDGAADPLVGVFQYQLTGLAQDDAVKFMHDQGVKRGTDTEIANVCDAYSNHPLSLRLLSGLIEHDAQMPGDIAAAPRVVAKADFRAIQGQILDESYGALPEKERTLLSRIAAFRNPMAYDALAIFNDLGDDEKFERALDDLQGRGLLQRDTKTKRYDLHPIVRRHAYERLEAKKPIHKRLRTYFAKLPIPTDDNIQTIDDLAPLIELYHHTVSAGQYLEAGKLLYDRLALLLYNRFGDYQTEIELMRRLFPDGENQPPKLEDKSAQAWVLNALANGYGQTGQSRSAVLMLQRVNDIYENVTKNYFHLATGLGNLAAQQVSLGELAAAERNLTRSIDLAREETKIVKEAEGHLELGRLLAYRGEFNQAAVHLDASLALFDRQAGEKSDKEAVEKGMVLNWAYRAVSALLMGGDVEAALKSAREAQTRALRNQNERNVVQTEWLLGRALVMEAANLSAAEAHLTEALTRCRRINVVFFEPNILLTWAFWHFANGRAKEAQVDAEKALAIAERCEYRLAQGEIHNFLAQLALDAGDREAARKEAEIARERAWCDGPPYCYKPALDEAERMLKILDA